MNHAERVTLVAQALAQFQAGQLVAAARDFDAVLTAFPDDAEALDLSALVAIGQGRYSDAVRRAARAAFLQDVPRFHGNLGVALGHAGRHEEAVLAYRRALARQPVYPEALNNLGISYLRLGQPQAAEEVFRAALSSRADYGEAWMNLGDSLQGQGRLVEAVAAYEQGIAYNPGLARVALGQVQRRLGRKKAALATYRADLAHRPDDPDALNNLAAALADAHNKGEGSAAAIGSVARARMRQAQLEEAASYAARAITLRPDFQEAHSNLGNILRWLDRSAEAEGVLRRAIALRPHDSGAYHNLGLVLQELGRHDEARAVLDLGIALAPEDAEIQYSRAVGLLRQGCLTEGWPAYECRFRIGQAGGSLHHFEANPPWRGEAAAGRTVLVVAEQGLGDTLQFVRYAPLMAERGIQVVVAAQAPLLPLLKTLPGVAESRVRIINQIGNYPPYDLHCPMLSLPRAFGTTLTTIPAPPAYLSVPAEVAARWAEHTAFSAASPTKRLRVGLIWGGNPRHVNDRRRSTGLMALMPLFRLPAIDWFSLQVGDPAGEVALVDPVRLPPSGLTDLAPSLTDFAETAAAVSQLDLLISVDTAVAHLGGALGRPVWLMLPQSPDWRWLTAGSRSPWYPSMRLFRQDQSARWQPVIAAIADALAGLLIDRGMVTIGELAEAAR